LIDWLTEKAIKLRWFFITLAVVAAAFGIWVDIDADAETDVETFMPQDTQELQDIHKLRDVLGTTDQLSIVYEAETIISNPIITWVDEVTNNIVEKFPQIVVETKSITHLVKQMNDVKLPEGESFKEKVSDIPDEQLKLFLNEHNTKGVITVGIKHLEADELNQFINKLESFLNQNQTNEVETTITGKSVLDVEMIQGISTRRYQMVLLGMCLVFISVLLIDRHPIKAFLALLPIMFIVGWSGLLMYLLDISYTPLTATLGALIIGIGTEFTV